MKKSEETRLYIIEKASPIFNKHGYVGTSMSQLIKAIGMTKGAIYGNFKNKDEIAIAVLNYNLSRIWDVFHLIKTENNNSNDKLIGFASFHLKTFESALKFGGCPMLNSCVDSDFVHPELKAIASKALSDFTKEIENIILEGIKLGEIKPDVDTKYYSSVMASLIEGSHLFSRSSRTTLSLEYNVRLITSIVNNELKI